MFTILFQGLYEPDGDGIITEPWFEGLGPSFFTLFQIMTLVSFLQAVSRLGCFFFLIRACQTRHQDTWWTILKQYQEYNRWAWVPFASFVVMTGFVVVNLMIAVICDAVALLGDEDKRGLYGAAGEDSCDPNNFAEYPYPTSEDRLRDLTMKLDEMMRVQEHMQKTMIELAQSLIEERGQRKEQQAHSIRPRPPRKEEQSRIGSSIDDRER